MAEDHERMMAALAVLDEKKRLIDTARPLAPVSVASLREDFVLRYAHETTAIEGNSLTLRETQVVLEGYTVGGKPLREHLEVANVRDALDWMDEVVRAGGPVTEETVQKAHAVLMDKILDDEQAGVYRRDPIYIRGAMHVPPNPLRVPEFMADLGRELAMGAGDEHPVRFAARMHVTLVRIHPFRDGNGRTSRLLACLLGMRAGYPAALYTSGDRATYFEALSKADSGDLDAFTMVTAQAMTAMADRYLGLLDLAWPPVPGPPDAQRSIQALAAAGEPESHSATPQLTDSSSTEPPGPSEVDKDAPTSQLRTTRRPVDGPSPFGR